MSTRRQAVVQQPGSALSRRGFLVLGGSAFAAALVGCAVDADDTGQDAAAGDTPSRDGTVRFAWWGNASRQELFAAYAERFVDFAEGAEVALEPSEYSSYMDRLPVQAAGGNLPDVFWMPANQIVTYGTRGALYDLGQLPDGVLDLSAFAPDDVEQWQIDGRQYGPVYTQYSPCTQLDRTAFEEVGITDFPDDESWDWDDFEQLARDYAEAAGDDRWGIANQAAFYQHAHLWIRQQGAEAFTEDGEIGFDVEVLGDWFAWWQQATESGAVMPTSISAGQTQWTQTGHRTAMYLVQLNQFQDNQRFSEDHELQLVKTPEVSGASDDYQFRYFTRLCVAENTADPELAGAFVDFMLNNELGAEMVGLASGIPSNPDVVDAIADLGDPVDVKILEMQGRIDEQPSRPRYEPPVGGEDWQGLIETASDDIFNGNVDIREAIEAGMDRLQSTIDAGRPD